MKSLGQHEALEVHELLVFKSLLMTKSYTMSSLAKDEALKAMLEANAKSGRHQLLQLEQFLKKEGIDA